MNPAGLAGFSRPITVEAGFTFCYGGIAEIGVNFMK